MKQFFGLDESSLEYSFDAGNHRLLPAVNQALFALQEQAIKVGFKLTLASSYRNYEAQLRIWNEKVSQLRPVLDDSGNTVSLDSLSEIDQIKAIMRFSALPGLSRHHWGTDMDVYDLCHLPEGYQVQLTPQECLAGGVMATFHDWLGTVLANFDFYRPYASDCGGVSPEMWHISFAPAAAEFTALASYEHCLRFLQGHRAEIALSGSVIDNFTGLYPQFIEPSLTV